MKSIHVLIALTSISFVLGDACSNGCIWESCQPFVRSWAPHRAGFLGRRFAYYSNSPCTFQLELLKCGDIHSNPGPGSTDNEHAVAYCKASKPVSSLTVPSHHEHTTYYSRKDLLELYQVNFPVMPSVWNTIRSLGINTKARTRRGHKGGRNARRKQNLTLCDDTLLHGAFCKFALWNARSMKSKTTIICEFIISMKLDVLALTETWLTGDSRDNCSLADIAATLPTHNFFHSPRKDRNGGGVGVYLSKSFNVKEKKQDTWDSFEYIDLVVAGRKCLPLRLVVVYRPQRNKSKQLTTSTFFDEFSSFLEILASEPKNVVIVGDFNFHMDVKDDRDARLFNDLINSFSLQQHVVQPTHRLGHTLDLVITRMSDDLVKEVFMTHYLPSDHAAVACSLNIRKPDAQRMTISSRKIKDINMDAFRSDIITSELCTSPAPEICTAVEQYDRVLQAILDKHAPLVSRTITCRPNAPWFNDDLRKAKQKLRGLERKMRSTKLEIHRQIFKDECHACNRSISEAKKEYYMNQFANFDSRDLFRTVDKISKPSSADILPSIDESDDQLAERFAKFFTEKIEKIACEFQSADFMSDDTSSSQCHAAFEKFSAVSVQQVLTLLSKSPSSSCSLDPIPTSLVKKCAKELAPVIARIINLSFESGYFPDSLTRAHIKPLIKNPKLDKNDLKSYRPIANLTFLSKIMERAAVSQIHEYLAANNLGGKMQSAYRKNHSCETALLKVNNDLLLALDSGQEAVLILLDFSAAFETIRHDVLNHRLQMRFGFTGKALQWLMSYMTNR